MEFRRIVDLEFKEMDEVALEKSWKWLSDPEMKELTTTPDFDKKSQREWYESLKTRTDYWIVVGWHEGEPITIGGLKNINGTDAEIFGYIGEKKYWGKAVGIDMMVRIHEHCRSLGLSSVYGVSLKTNRNSVAIMRRFGYEYEKDLDDDRIILRLQL